MAEDSRFWNTDGIGDGDDAGITTAQMQEIFRSLFAGHLSNLGGVRPDYLNELAVSGSSSPVAVASGVAVVYGLLYTNSASVNVAIPTPSVNPRVDRVVLRADWTAQTVRVTRIAGSEATVPSAPSLTQTPNTTWDIPLAQVHITTGGTITVTDEREWLTLVGDGGVSLAKLQNITSDRLLGRDTSGSGVPEQISLGSSLEFSGSGSIRRAALTGNVTASADSNATTIATGVVHRTHLETDGGFQPSAMFISDNDVTFDNVAAQMDLQNVQWSTAENVYTRSTNDITIDETGHYLVTFAFAIGHSTGSSLAVAICWLEAEGVEVPGSRCYVNVPTAEFTTASKVMILKLTAGDTLKLFARRIAGSDTLRALDNQVFLGFHQLHK